MKLMWAWLMLSRISGLVVDLRTPDAVDSSQADLTGAPLMVAEAVSMACAPDGLTYPRQDSQLLAVLARDGVPVDLGALPYGAMVELSTGALAVATSGGLIESHGAGLSIVPAEPARMVRAWRLPGVAYFERTLL